MHQWQKFGENPSTDTGDIAKHKTTTWIADGRTHGRMDDPKTYSLRQRLPAAEA